MDVGTTAVVIPLTGVPALMDDFSKQFRRYDDARPKLEVSRYHAAKGVYDRCLGSALLLIFSPMILVLMFVVRLSSSGRAIYKQTRVGKDGKLFQVYKIRTMYQNAEAVHGPQWAVPGDPRISPLGRLLRFLHLDELPQLVNVARGEMSLVGPRPERPEFVKHLSLQIAGYSDRLAVLPGITGLAQINLPPDESLQSVRRKVIVDREYIERASAVLDIQILICTALRMLGVRHGRAARWLGIEYRFHDNREAALNTLRPNSFGANGVAMQREMSIEGMQLNVGAQPTSHGAPELVFSAAITSPLTSCGDQETLLRRPR